jgi:hypothetical protein
MDDLYSHRLLALFFNSAIDSSELPFTQTVQNLKVILAPRFTLLVVLLCLVLRKRDHRVIGVAGDILRTRRRLCLHELNYFPLNTILNR